MNMPGNFTIPDYLKEKCEAIRKPYRLPLVMGLAEELTEIGLPDDQAITVAVHDAMIAAARAAMIAAIALQKRKPNRDRWMEMAEHHFDEALTFVREKFPDACREIEL